MILKFRFLVRLFLLVSFHAALSVAIFNPASASNAKAGHTGSIKHVKEISTFVRRSAYTDKSYPLPIAQPSEVNLDSYTAEFSFLRLLSSFFGKKEDRLDSQTSGLKGNSQLGDLAPLLSEYENARDQLGDILQVIILEEANFSLRGRSGENENLRVEFVVFKYQFKGEIKTSDFRYAMMREPAEQASWVFVQPDYQLASLFDQGSDKCIQREFRGDQWDLLDCS